MYDAIVIGARCAGSPTAMLLARRGLRVLLVDKANFPSDTISSHYLHQQGVAALKRWGLRDRVAATGCPPLTRMSFDTGDVRLVGSAPAVEGVAEGYCVRRTYLDKVLVDAAVEAGVEVREAFEVDELLSNGQRVTGIRGRSRGGSSVSESARIVIGADGARSLVARSTLAPESRYIPPLTCQYYTYFSGIPALEGPELYPRPGFFVVASPTNDGLTQVTVVWPQHEFARRRLDIEANFIGSIAEHAPGLYDRLLAGKREERFYGTPLIPNYIRKPWGEGWALVGDAGYMKDPITARGMSDAFRDAELLAGAISAGFLGRCPMDQALAWYERQRDASIMQMFQHACELAQLAPMPPQMIELLRAIQDKPDEISRFFGTISGATPIAEFYSQQNIARLIAGATEHAAA